MTRRADCMQEIHLSVYLFVTHQYCGVKIASIIAVTLPLPLNHPREHTDKNGKPRQLTIINVNPVTSCFKSHITNVTNF